MKIRLANWKTKTLKSRIDKINPAPQYQRTSVWSQSKKKLLIDSILRGYDLPKFYLRATPHDQLYEFEITDGQQRVRAICEYMDGKYKLDKCIINGVEIAGFYADLKKNREKIDDYELNIAIIDESSPEEIRSLFARLQMGMRLNQVELRHAMNSNIGAAIFSIVETHPFFKDCKISNSRFKHQDYLDHVLTYSYYNGQTDVKASSIEKLYKDLASAGANVFGKDLSNANRVLDLMKSLNDVQKGIFKNKWAFFDVYILLSSNLGKLKSINHRKFVMEFKKFERKRLLNNKNPEILINSDSSEMLDRDLYDYIIAFNTSGNLQGKISVRSRVLVNKFIGNGIYLKP